MDWEPPRYSRSKDGTACLFFAEDAEVAEEDREEMTLKQRIIRGAVAVP
jgi:hypothetical protein